MGRSEIEALGYIGVEVSNLDRWRAFATDILGLQVGDRSDGAVDLRMDGYAFRIRLTEGALDDLSFAGWEVRDETALVALATRLEGLGVSVEHGDEQLMRDRQVAGLISFADPEGNRHEAFYGPLQKADAPFVSPLGTSFRTGRQGLGHLVLSCRGPADDDGVLPRCPRLSPV